MKCDSPQTKSLCESTAFAEKSESVLWAAAAGCLSPVSQWEKPAYSERLFVWASPLGKHSIHWEIRVGFGDAGASCLS